MIDLESIITQAVTREMMMTAKLLEALDPIQTVITWSLSPDISDIRHGHIQVS